MERVGPIPTVHAAQAAGRVIPVGKGWVLEPLEAGFLLKALVQGGAVRITPEEAQALRQGEVSAEMLAARHGLLPPHPPGAAVTVALSDEARRIAGLDRKPAPGAGPAGKENRAAGIPVPQAVTSGLAVAALLILALVWAI